MCLFPAAVDGIALRKADDDSWGRYAAAVYAAAVKRGEDDSADDDT
jgi:hypothetical protein